jgi:hypothetical protein
MRENLYGLPRKMKQRVYANKAKVVDVEKKHKICLLTQQSKHLPSYPVNNPQMVGMQLAALHFGARDSFFRKWAHGYKNDAVQICYPFMLSQSCIMPINILVFYAKRNNVFKLFLDMLFSCDTLFARLFARSISHFRSVAWVKSSLPFV